MKALGEFFSNLELSSAIDMLDTITPLEPFKGKINSYEGSRQTYDSSFNGSMMKNGIYYDCKFQNVNFVGTNGNHSIMKKCKFDNCVIQDANFTYSNFSNSNLNFDSKSTSYNFSDFTDAIILKSNIESSSLSECYFWNSRILDTEIKHCEFKKSIFYNCLLENIDLSKTTLDYAEFIASRFNNVTLPFFGVLNLISGFKEIVEQDEITFKPARSDYLATGKTYIDNIRLLKPIFYYENNYLALANIYTYDGEIENAYYSILNGLKYACETKNFGLIRHLCRFASINSYFTPLQLKKFYEFLDNSLDVKSLGYVEYYNYLNELQVAKNLLIDCPFNRDIIEIEIKTKFAYNDNKKLAETLRTINSVFSQYAPESNNYITVRHNSPPDITIIVSDNIYILYLVFFALQLIFCKSLNGIEKLQTIIKNRHDIKLQKLDEELKKLEIEKMKSELDKTNSKESTILLPSDFDSISYTVKTYNDLPKDLRKM